ncbi:putative orphan protein [Pseudoalteromonas translucida]|uniref:Orphan protein n=1 Tax=Pseudoalteromonas translucida (strain TAC 125) TaxID=326442 RepID=Q3IEM1_PSET1|nr:putative orphan protein [Pseudoalteromonas translucida]
MKLNEIFTVFVGNLYVCCGALYEMSGQFIRFRRTLYRE